MTYYAEEIYELEKENLKLKQTMTDAKLLTKTLIDVKKLLYVNKLSQN